jgi:hypothetical protein
LQSGALGCKIKAAGNKVVVDTQQRHGNKTKYNAWMSNHPIFFCGRAPPPNSAAFHISPNNATIIAQSKKTIA